MTHGDTVMENVTNPSVNDLLELVEKLDPEQIRNLYPQIISALQARMQRDQEPFS